MLTSSVQLVQPTMKHFALPAIIMFGLVTRVAHAAVIYDASFSKYTWMDYTLYRLGAEKIIGGDLAFTNNLFMVRPPTISTC